MRHFYKNFIFVENGWKLSCYSRAFFWPFYRSWPIWLIRRLGVFRGRRIWILGDNLSRTIFGGSGPLLAQNMGISREQLVIQAQRSHHCVSHLNCSKGWCPFAKILKSSKTDENTFIKGFFLPFYWNPLIWTKPCLWLFSRLLNLHPLWKLI